LAYWVLQLNSASNKNESHGREKRFMVLSLNMKYDIFHLAVRINTTLKLTRSRSEVRNERSVGGRVQRLVRPQLFNLRLCLCPYGNAYRRINGFDMIIMQLKAIGKDVRASRVPNHFATVFNS
jgi:hypothetical protein